MMLTIKNASKHFGGITALEDCSIEVEKGSITAIIGPNGSGKSTLFNIISNTIKKNKGSITLDNEPLHHPDFKIAKKGVARTFQEVRLFQNLTIEEHLLIAISQNDESLLTSLIKKEQQPKEKIREILELVQLNKPLTTYATDLSYGQRKLLDIAIAIAKPHTLLMLDEPVAGINPALRKTIKHILKKLNTQGETILLIEHDMNFVMDLAQKIYVMDEGTIIAKGEPKKIQKNKKVLEAYLGE